MERFSIEVSRRTVEAGREAGSPAAVAPCGLCIIGNCETPEQRASRADRNPTVERPQGLSPLSDA